MNVTIGSSGRYNKGRKSALRAGIIGRPFPLPPPPTKYVLVPTKPKTSSSSRNVGRLLMSGSASSSASQYERLTQRHIQDLHRKENEEARHRLNQMTTEEVVALQAFRTSLNTDDNDDDAPAPEHTINLDDILAGNSIADVSHAGGEFAQLLAIEDDIFGTRKRKDPRTRRDRAQRRVDAFAVQLPALIDAYMQWQLALGDRCYESDYSTPDLSTAQRAYDIAVVDVFSSTKQKITELSSDMYVASAIIRHGLIPCAPYNPHTAYSIRLLELYRRSHNHCPHLSIYAFSKTLCDLHGVSFKTHMSRRFSIAYDLYLELHRGVDSHLNASLGRDTPDYRLRHVCPCCTYALVGEPKLQFNMLYAMDGNDSLKRIIRREAPPEGHESGGLVMPSSEAADSREVGKGWYLTREEVDKWSKETLAALFADFTEDDDNPCAERWKNMSQELAAKMWAIFDESGLFIAACRHGFVLVMADMVRSGELSKYPLAVVAKLLETFGVDLGGGYDIGCRFKTTLANSPLGAKARALNHRCLVGAFHGHAHNRLCQSTHLATYVEGLGTEDLETCERIFSKSNALAPAVRYMSRFHRRQAIAEFFDYMGKYETFQNLGTFLLNNYKQALSVLGTRDVVLATLKQIGADPDTVHEWLVEEREYLLSLKKEPLGETLEMEYLTLLLKLQASTTILASSRAQWSISTPSNITSRQHPNSVSHTTALETAHRHAIETYDKDLLAVQSMEMKLAIRKRWVAEDSEWKEAANKLSMRRYQRCLDTLEGLVVARMFELTKMNMSQTGYNLRKHIATSLKARSTALRSALARYNAAACELVPPRQTLTWEQIVDYAFLSDFDLLRDTRSPSC
ncbi:hypothetical protein NLJ89_g8746 [Agrocybe chaxingu]|uniref:CxC2-like cysteine cluster KDZ transposase-associated domain-containing protein n=1 Tax=Agrocybe chaxingu TaxID=84603 RepID=A0A9W8JX01_9AGAR|nr:hypothetical protein NLJ89_g8746 [Agrocybe chaxingu]